MNINDTDFSYLFPRQDMVGTHKGHEHGVEQLNEWQSHATILDHFGLLRRQAEYTDTRPCYIHIILLFSIYHEFMGRGHYLFCCITTQHKIIKVFYLFWVYENEPSSISCITEDDNITWVKLQLEVFIFCILVVCIPSLIQLSSWCLFLVYSWLFGQGHF